MKLSQIKDLDFELMLSFDDRELFNFCKVPNSYVQRLCSDEVFWKKRFYQNFPTLVKTKHSLRKWKNFYMYISYWANKLKEEFNFVSNEMRDDPKKYYDIIQSYKNEMKKPPHFLTPDEFKSRVINRYLLYPSIQQGFLDLIKYSPDLGAYNFQAGLNISAYFGNMEAFLYFEKLGANNYEEALDSAGDGINFFGEDKNEYMANFIKSKMI